MAYISKEEVKKIRENIKKEFGSKYKFSVTISDYTGVNIKLMSSPLQFSKTYEQINHYYTDRYEHSEMWNRVIKAANSVKENYNRNAGDMGADYPDMTYFLEIGLGKWDKPYKQI